MRLTTIDVFKAGRWDDFVANHPQGTAFHLSNWGRVLQRTYRYTPYYVILEDYDREIKAGCPFFLIKSWLTGTRLVCLPFTDVCYPLATSGEDIETLLSAVIEKAKKEKADHIEVRGPHPHVALRNSDFENHNYYKAFRLDLSRGTDHLWKGLHKTTRRHVRRARKAKLEIERSGSEKAMRDFYLLNLATRKKHGVPPQPYDFFENIWRELIVTGLASVSLVKYRGTSIAGGVFLAHGDTIYYKFNASDSNYLQYRPNHFLVWDAIQYACERGYKFLDGGRTSPDNLGLVSFKRSWGMQETDLPYYYWPTIKGVSSTKQRSLKYRMMTSLMRRAPTTIFRVAGELFCKHLG